MFHLLQRHPVPIAAHLENSFVLTYAYPADELARLLPPGLEIDARNGCGFLAVAYIQTRHLRAALAPEWTGLDFQFIGYRIFARYKMQDGRRLRGLFILRSEADRRLMTWAGNLCTHYHWNYARFHTETSLQNHHLRVVTPKGAADLDADFDLNDAAPPLPENSCFKTWHEARLFAGPMPFTFGYERETHSMVRVEGVREDWHPRPAAVKVRKIGLLEQKPWADLGSPRLVSAFAVADIPYLWKRGIVEEVV